MKYTVRPQSWLDIEETMTYLRDHADDEAAARFWQRTQDIHSWPWQGNLPRDGCDLI